LKVQIYNQPSRVAVLTNRDKYNWTWRLERNFYERNFLLILAVSTDCENNVKLTCNKRYMQRKETIMPSLCLGLNSKILRCQPIELQP